MAEIALSSVQTGLSSVQTVLTALDFFEAKRISSFLAYESQIKDLRRSVTTIKNVLKDAESSKALTNDLQLQGYIQQLKDVIYEADDLFDEFVTQVELGNLTESGALFDQVRSLFSNTGLEICKKAQNIKKQLSDIALDRRFSIVVDNKPISSRGAETCSYIDSKDIVGRDADKKAILDKLLESKSQNVSFMTIVGVGGLGKTALAQLVFNDEDLKQEFGKEMFWVCVSDQFDVKTILCNIIELIRIQDKDRDNGVPNTKEAAQILFREKIQKKKYFIVLDDVWNEDREKWVDLQSSLTLGQEGSRVLVTTRSEITARVIGNEQPYMLQTLSPEDSWQLFEMVAFDNQQSVNHNKMVEIGKNIVEKCNNIPLAIKVVGSILYGQEIGRWESFKNIGLAEIDNGDNKIMSVLKLSYHNLTSSLKSCFSYCALFPKDFEIKKGLLIKLWMAQGYIEPFNRGESIEYAAEEHFRILLRRCFFQDVKKDEYDEIVSVKIHDLMHDVAQEVGGGEVKVLSLNENSLGDRIRHLNILNKECFESSSTWTNHLRTLLTGDFHTFNAKDIQIGKWKSLRVLVLKYLNGGIKQNSFSGLQHLRYLDLSECDFIKLPKSITELHNLQTLILYRCFYLKELPQNFSKLVKLSHLDLAYCSVLEQLPHDFSKLEKLNHLDLAYCSVLKQLPHDFSKLEKLNHLVLYGCKELIGMPLGLDNLKKHGALANLAGSIVIEIGENCNNVEVMKDMSGEYLSKIPGLKKVQIRMRKKGVEAEAAEAALKMLEPHPNLKKLYIEGYEGRTIPWWRSANADLAPLIQLSNLVSINIFECCNLVTLPSSLSKLPFLKSLTVEELINLEYMETRSNLPGANDTTFFPSLVQLQIHHCLKLKGWFREEGLGDTDCACWGLLSFPRLSTLWIMDCYNMTSFPPCPTVETIHLLLEVPNKVQLLEKMIGKAEEGQGGVTIGNNHASTSSSSSSSHLATLDISDDIEVESLSEYEKVFQMCASSLKRFEIKYCHNLRRFSRGLEHLTALEFLEIGFMEKLEFWEDNNEDIMAWVPLQHTLHSLTFHRLLNMKSLPEGMKHLTSLQTLRIIECGELKELPEGFETLTSLETLWLRECKKLKGLPEGISSLTSLRSLTILGCDAIKSLPEGFETLTSLKYLEIEGCRGLVERLKEPNGQDWQKIQHIPKRDIRQMHGWSELSCARSVSSIGREIQVATNTGVDKMLIISSAPDLHWEQNC